MKRIIAVFVLLSLTLTACGVSSDKPTNGADSTKQVNEGSNTELTTKEDTDIVKQDDEQTDSVDVESTSKIHSVDLYGTYSPRDEIVNTTCMESPIIQVGDNLFYLGKSTVQDFLDAGFDLYYDSEPHDSEKNKSEWELRTQLSTKAVDMYLEGIIMFELTCYDSNGEGLKLDDIVTDVGIYYKDETRMVLKDTVIPELHSIYLPGGVGFTQYFKINESFGTPYYDDERTEPFNYRSRAYENFKASAGASRDNPRYYFRYDTKDEQVYQVILSILIN